MQLKKVQTTLIRIALGTALAVLGLFVLLPLALPFLLGWGAAMGAEPGVRRLCDRTPLPRWAAAGLCVTGLFAVVGTALFFLCKTVCGQIIGLAGDLPRLLAGLAGPLEQIRAWLEKLVASCPEALRAGLERSVAKLFDSSELLLSSLPRYAGALASKLAGGMPGLFLSLSTTVLSAYMISAGLPELGNGLRRRLPAAWREKLDAFLPRLKGTLGGYLLAQLKLMGISFAVLALGLWILRVEFALLIALLIAVMDALPVLGSGLALVPWALISFLQHDPRLGFGLLILYGVQALLRCFLEPRILGRQIGLHPLLTLICFYLGYRLMGVAGMVLFPIAAILIKQFVELVSPGSGPAVRKSTASS